MHPHGERMKVLCVLTSSNQLYSGMGRALFEPARRLGDRIAYTFAIDDHQPRNVQILREHAWRNGFDLDVGPAEFETDALDARTGHLAELLERTDWDAIECIGWADAATHAGVLDRVGARPLVYTPHHQPSWTVAMVPSVQQRVERVHQAMLSRADLILCDSPWERDELQRRAPRGGRFLYLPLGGTFRTSPSLPCSSRRALLFVGDLAEPRKRFDRVLTLMNQLRRRRPELRLTVIGNRSDSLSEALPDSAQGFVDAMGYVSEPALRRAYSESLGLVLLSEYEAFGIPILESLAAGTPVYLSQQPTTESLFSTFRGAHFCAAEDPDSTAEVVEAALDRGQQTLDEVAAEGSRLRAQFDWDLIAERKWRAMAAAWTVRARHGRVG